MKIILSLSILTFLTSCSLDKMFLQPTNLSQQLESGYDISDLKVTYKVKEDSITAFFNPTTLQPTFLKNHTDTMNLDYTIESVVFNSSSGNKLNGWFLKPKNVTPQVTLLHFHGNAAHIINQHYAMTPLLNYGFQAFVFDYSGFGFSEGKATRKNVLKDGNSALTYLKSRGDIKNTKLIIYGQSLGGHLSAVVAAQREAEIDGLVIEGAFSSHKDIAAAVAGGFGRIFVREQYSAYKAIRDYDKPLLLIHSSEDKIIPIELGKKIYANANEPKEFYETKDCHMCATKYHSELISEKIKEMIQSM